MAFDWGNLITTAVSTGTSLYDMYNKSQIAGDLQSAATSPVIDPYGADERQRAQDEMSALRADPSRVEQTPGYQFALQQGQKGIDRGAGQKGHYRGTNRLYDLAEFNQGLASKTYDTTMDRLGKEAGAGMQPAASAYADLYSTGAGVDASQGTQIADATGGAGGLGDWGKILTNFSDALGGDSGGGLGDLIPDELKELVPDEMKESLGITSDAPAVGEYTGADNLSAATALGGGAVDRATALEGLGPNADLGGAAMGDMFASQNMIDTSLANSPSGGEFSNTGTDFGTLSSAGNIGAIGGGILGGQGLTKLVGAEGGGAVATNAIGGAAGAAIGGGLGTMMGGGGFMAGAGAGAAMAGPAIAAAPIIMGAMNFMKGQAQSKGRKGLAGQLFQNMGPLGDLTADPNAGPNVSTRTAPGVGSYATPDNRIDQGYQWTTPGGGSYWLDEATYGNIQGGDIDKRYRLYDQYGANTGDMWDMNSNSLITNEDLSRTRDQDLINRVQANQEGGGAEGALNNSQGSTLMDAYQAKQRMGQTTGAAPTQTSTFIRGDGEGGDGGGNRTVTGWEYKPATTSCFIAGTLVRMADGSTKPIETIKTGELILASQSKDHSAKTMAPAAVVEVEVVELGDRKLFSFNGSKPFITHDHLVMTTKGWKVGSPKAHLLEYSRNLAKHENWAEISSQQHYDYEVLALAEGDILKTEDGPVRLDSLVESDGPPDKLVYNLRFSTDFDKLFVGTKDAMYLVQD